MKIFGLFGEKLCHSLSPQIHEIIFNELKINGVYNLFEIKKDNFYNSIKSIKQLGINGVNVTIPYKIEIMHLLDEITDEALNIGAVNTVKICEDKAIGYNTDYYGFGYMLLKGNIQVEGNNFYILGTGGASKVIVQYLLDNKAHNVTLVSRNKNILNTGKVQIIDYIDLNSVKDSYCIINTTPIGMYPDINSCCVPISVLEQFKIAMDIIYNPVETLFLKYARENGLVTINGLYMLLGQAIKAQEIWHDITIEKDLFDNITVNLLCKYNNLVNL